MFTPSDYQMMQTALDLAWKGKFSTSPNPRVGCVIAQGNQIIGQGFHIKAGEPHAEVHALRQAGYLAKGATAYVTLEPCSHYGRTPPCAKALIKSGISRVIAAIKDPNPLVAGKGLALLEQAGIETHSGLLEKQARILNRGFLSRIERDRPFIRLKCAASLDGKTALSDGQSKWITGEDARLDVQTLRAESCAVLTGIGTILADDPLLNVRSFPTLRQPTRVILDSDLKTPLHAQIIKDSQSPTIIVTLNQEQTRWCDYTQYSHIKILQATTLHGKIDLPNLLTQLAQVGLGEILVETGATLASAFLSENLVDEIVLYQAAKILGMPGKPLFTLPEDLNTLQQPSQWHTQSVEIIGNDIKWVLGLVQ